MDQFNTPNLVLAMAQSYNERGQHGYTQVVTNTRDQRKVNCFYEVAVNALTRQPTLYLAKRPGFVESVVGLGAADNIPYCIIGDPTSGSGNARSWMACRNGSIIRVVNEAGTQTTVLTNAGSWPIYFDMANIGSPITRYGVLQIADAGPPAFRTFVSSEIATWTEISDSDFTGLAHVGKMEHMDGYAVQMTTNNRLYSSDLNSLTAWSPASFETKDTEQDYARGVARFGNILLAFGTATIQGFYNAGSRVGSPFKRIKQLSERIGLQLPQESANLGSFYFDIQPDVNLLTGSRHYYTVLGQRMYFVSAKGGFGVKSVYTFNGAIFEKVSTPFIDKILQEQGYFHIGAIDFRGQEAIAIVLTGVSTTPCRALLFFPNTNEWFEWTSMAVQFIQSRLSKVFIGIGGESSANRTHNLGGSIEQYFDSSAGGAYTMLAQFHVSKRNNARESMAWAGVVADSQSASASASSGAFIEMRFSKNDYDSFGTAYSLDLRKRKKQAYRIGAYEDLDVRLTHSGDAECRIEAFIARTM